MPGLRTQMPGSDMLCGVPHETLKPCDTIVLNLAMQNAADTRLFAAMVDVQSVCGIIGSGGGGVGGDGDGGSDGGGGSGGVEGGQ